MFTIKIDNGAEEMLLYNPVEASRGYAVVKPSLTTELGRASVLEFTMPQTNPQYNNIAKLKTMVRLYEDGELLSQGRCRETSRAFDNMIHCTCESELAFLQDVDIAPYGTATRDFEHWALYLMGLYNEQAPAGRKIAVGTIPTGLPQISKEGTSVSTVGDELTAIADAVGVQIRFRRYGTNGYFAYIDFVVTPTTAESQEIRFKKNLLDFAETTDASNLITRIKPYGAEVDSVRVEGDVQINTAAESLYNTVVYRIQTYDELDTKAKVEAEARRQLARATLTATIEISAVDWHLIDASTPRFKVGNLYRVVSEPHGLDEPYMCSRIELDLTNPERNRYVFGATKRLLTDAVKGGK